MKKVRLQTQCEEFASLRVSESKSISDFSGRMMVVVNKIKPYEEKVEDISVVEKILRFVNHIIEESKNLGTLTVDQLVSSLRTYEEMFKMRHDQFLEHVLEV